MLLFSNNFIWNIFFTLNISMNLSSDQVQKDLWAVIVSTNVACILMEKSTLVLSWFLVEAEKWEEQVSAKFEQMPFKNERVVNFGSCDQWNTNWQLCDVSCELPWLPFALSEFFIFPQENVHACKHPNTIIANYFSFQKLFRN